MPPRLFKPAAVRQPFTVLLLAPSRRTAQRFYSSADEPLIRVTNIPAGSSGHIRILELNRAGARNAISKALLGALRAEIDDVHSQYDAGGNEIVAPSQAGPTRALVIASAVDSCFCAGADLKERRGFTQQEYATIAQSNYHCHS